ncbi:hypothetical protein CDV52_13805, partial [Haematobacter missouriensis]
MVHPPAGAPRAQVTGLLFLTIGGALTHPGFDDDGSSDFAPAASDTPLRNTFLDDPQRVSGCGGCG